MQLKTNAIVLRSLRYGESQAMIWAYTAERGFISIAVPRSSSRRAAGFRCLFFPLSAVHLLLRGKGEAEVWRVQELQPLYLCRASSLSLTHNTVAAFLTDFLSDVLRAEQQGDAELLKYLQDYIQRLDASTPPQAANLHLGLMAGLLPLLGIGIDTTTVTANSLFVPEEGAFVPAAYQRSPEQQRQTDLLLRVLKGEDLQSMAWNKVERNSVLQQLVEHYHYCFPSLLKMRSLKVLQEIFQEL